MKADGIIRRFDDLGRIVIPKELRRQIFGANRKEGVLFGIELALEAIKQGIVPGNE